MKKLISKIKCFFGRHEDEVIRKFTDGMQQTRCANCTDYFLVHVDKKKRRKWTETHQKILGALYPHLFWF